MAQRLDFGLRADIRVDSDPTDESIVIGFRVATVPEPSVAADFDEDGDVDGEDFLIWQEGFGTPSGAEKIDGDYDNDGDVDGDDFLGWQTEFGSGGNAAAVAVPEPSSILLLLAALSLLLTGPILREKRGAGGLAPRKMHN